MIGHSRKQTFGEIFYGSYAPKVVVQSLGSAARKQTWPPHVASVTLAMVRNSRRPCENRRWNAAELSMI